MALPENNSLTQSGTPLKKENKNGDVDFSEADLDTNGSPWKNVARNNERDTSSADLDINAVREMGTNAADLDTNTVSILNLADVECNFGKDPIAREEVDAHVVLGGEPNPTSKRSSISAKVNPALGTFKSTKHCNTEPCPEVLANEALTSVHLPSHSSSRVPNSLSNAPHCIENSPATPSSPFLDRKNIQENSLILGFKGCSC